MNRPIQAPKRRAGAFRRVPSAELRHAVQDARERLRVAMLEAPSVREAWFAWLAAELAIASAETSTGSTEADSGTR
jgi:hypothetical protein